MNTSMDELLETGLMLAVGVVSCLMLALCLIRGAAALV
jgi:hypothetical protein